MIKSIFLLFVTIVVFALTSKSQTFSNNTAQGYNTWNSSNVWATALSRTIAVSTLPSSLSAGGMVLKQVNLRMGDGTSVNLTSYSIRLISPVGTVISIVSLGDFNATTAKNVDIKYRDDILLQFPSSSNQNPFDVGYYRVTTSNSFSTVNGENPNGNWTLEIIENTSFEIAFIGVDLVFGSEYFINDISGSTINDNCSTPQCISESTITKATVSAYTGDVNDPNTLAPYPGGCNWNGAHNNSAWFIFQPTSTTVKITISGITNTIQTLVVDEMNACVGGSQTVPIGGCPIDAVNDTYTSPRYTPSTGSSSNEQFNLSGLIPGNNYYLVVDGNGGVVSPLYIELSGGLVDICCATVISGSTDICAGSASVLYSQIGGALGGTWSVSPVSAGTINASGNFTSGTPFTDVPATISYDDGSCIKTFSITVHVAPNPGSNGTITVCSNGSLVDLFSSLGGTPDITGTWSGPSVLSGAHLGTYDPAVLSAGTYTYTVSASSCIDATATVIVTETPAPNPGSNGIITACSNGSSVDLFSSLGGTPDNTGTWSGPSVLAGAHLGTYDPVTLSAGTYTYTVSASSCVDATATVIVTETPAPDAGINGIITVCSNGSSVDLFSSLGGTPDITGIWSGPSVLSGAHLGTYDPVSSLVGTYMYTVSASFCIDAATTVIVTETAAPNAGIVSVLDTILCSGSTTTASSTVAGGTWTSTNVLVAIIDINTGEVTAIGVGTTTMIYTVLGTAGCLGTDVTSTVDVTVTVTPMVPTGNLSQGFCTGSSPTIADLTTTSGIDIQWYDAAVGGSMLASGTILTNGNHYYATQTVAGCESSTSLDVLVYFDSIELNLVSENPSICGQQTGFISVLALNGVGTYFYSWSIAETGNSITNVASGEYTASVTDSLGCVSELSIELDCIGNVPEIITPNGDGKNETWIVNLDSKASVQLYNRWGNLIYSAQPYMDDWDGKANEGVTLGNDYLPSGTYFFVIDYKDGNKPTSGYIELIR